jgi:hypothetical protein
MVQCLHVTGMAGHHHAFTDRGYSVAMKREASLEPEEGEKGTPEDKQRRRRCGAERGGATHPYPKQARRYVSGSVENQQETRGQDQRSRDGGGILINLLNFPFCIHFSPFCVRGD